MFKMSVLNKLLIDAKADFVSEVDIYGNTTFLAYLDKDAPECIAPTVYYFNANKVFYQDNEIGEIVRNYLNVCKTL